MFNFSMVLHNKIAALHMQFSEGFQFKTINGNLLLLPLMPDRKLQWLADVLSILLPAVCGNLEICTESCWDLVKKSHFCECVPVQLVPTTSYTPITYVLLHGELQTD